MINCKQNTGCHPNLPSHAKTQREVIFGYTRDPEHDERLFSDKEADHSNWVRDVLWLSVEITSVQINMLLIVST